MLFMRDAQLDSDTCLCRDAVYRNGVIREWLYWRRRLDEEDGWEIAVDGEATIGKRVDELCHVQPSAIAPVWRMLILARRPQRIFLVEQRACHCILALRLIARSRRV